MEIETHEEKAKKLVEVIISKSKRDEKRAPKISEPVLNSFMITPREDFVPQSMKQFAYNDRPLSIGDGQTISQPYVVALMTELMKVKKGDKVLEIGTGSGYQSAILANMGVEVYTIEIVDNLYQKLVPLMKDYQNVKLKRADGYFGWPEAAPFDSIIITAAPNEVPEPLIEQLKVGGVMVAPVDSAGGYQF